MGMIRARERKHSPLCRAPIFACACKGHKLAISTFISGRHRCGTDTQRYRRSPPSPGPCWGRRGTARCSVRRAPPERRGAASPCPPTGSDEAGRVRSAPRAPGGRTGCRRSCTTRAAPLARPTRARGRPQSPRALAAGVAGPTRSRGWTGRSSCSAAAAAGRRRRW
eukprot:scaffold3009_cov108-Isochrysis_galbana.AAC.12